MRLHVVALLCVFGCEKSNNQYVGSADLLAGDDLAADSDGMLGGDGGGDMGPVACTTDQPCFTGSDATKRNQGACRDGTRYCINNFLGPCSGEVLPNTESCNGIDDDCDGTIDNSLGNITCGVGACARPLGGTTIPACVNGSPNSVACVPGNPAAEICGDTIDQNCNGVADDGCSCIYVAPPCPLATPPAGCFVTAIDTPTCGSSTAPCATVKYAIENRAGMPGAASTVCVAALGACASTASRGFTYVESALTMKNGVSVLGGFDLAASPSPSPIPPRNATACITRIQINAHNAVTFPSSVTTPTTIDGFEILNSDTTDNITSGVAVLGSTGAIISNNYINGGGGTAESHGVRIADSGMAATPLLIHNAIVGGTAPTAIGISSTNSAPTIRQHCDTINGSTGRCTTYGCAPAMPARIGPAYIHGRTNSAGTKTNAYGVQLTNSPGTLIEENSISGSECTPGALLTTGDVVGVKITGDASSTILRANLINALQAGANAVGVWAESCAGSGPSLWLFNNERISGNSPQTLCKGDGVRAVGNCHPRIDGNNLIRGGEEGSQSPANGVYCTGGSQCNVLRNNAVEGSGSGFPPISAGVRCDANSCGRIEGNRITGRAGQKTYGIILGATGVLVTTNIIDAGCTPNGEGAGVDSLDSFANLQNNIIRGVACSNPANSSAGTWAVRASLGAGTNEISLDGNDLFAMGEPANNCTGRALGLVDGGATTPHGLFRNNILHAGFCPTTYDVTEASTNTHPRVFTNNDLWFATGPTALYLGSGTTPLTTLAAVNLLVDPTNSTNFSSDPLFVSAVVFPQVNNPDYHLQMTSPCIDKGVAAVGGPANDFDYPGNLNWQSPSGLKVRANTPDVGADEAK